MPVDVDFTSSDELFVGEAKVITMTVKNAAGAAQDITGWTLKWQVRLTRYNATVLLEKQTGGAGITLKTQSGGTLGQFEVAIDDQDFIAPVALRAGTYYHGAMRTNAGSEDVVAEGKLVLRKAAVR